MAMAEGNLQDVIITHKEQNEIIEANFELCGDWRIGWSGMSILMVNTGISMTIITKRRRMAETWKWNLRGWHKTKWKTWINMFTMIIDYESLLKFWYLNNFTVFHVKLASLIEMIMCSKNSIETKLQGWERLSVTCKRTSCKRYMRTKAYS